MFMSPSSPRTQLTCVVRVCCQSKRHKFQELSMGEDSPLQQNSTSLDLHYLDECGRFWNTCTVHVVKADEKIKKRKMYLYSLYTAQEEQKVI